MASAADTNDTAKADAAAEKAYADAASAVPAKKTETAVVALEPAPVPAKIDAAVAEVKAAPKKAAPVRKAKKPAAKKVVKKAAAPKKSVAKAAPAKKPVARAAAKKTVKNTATKTPAPRVSAVAQLKDKIMATAKKTDFTDTLKTATAEAQTKAKAAYDKLQAYAGEMTEFTKGNIEAVVESGKILGAGVQDMARGEVEAAKGAFETVTADLKAMAAVKSPAELFKLQGEIARRNFDAAVARYSKNAETSMKLANDAFAPLSNRVSLAVEKVSKAAA
ncbi:phasin family protein [Tsuneonella sp. YG55]|uniref:Phasin family protein n=1 Tax=Tsuneonella litorea TaxID=2976475 RepID=A0A9X2W1B2_9SPHN|nr:phasin family protein [Tsuneonella litorea]MCT2559197.1 phasin family protein [Tsuneonella litorea]